MKKIFKGCLVTVLASFVLLIVVILSVYIYSKIPNDVIISSTPITYNEIKEDIDFPQGEIPDYIRNSRPENILYQASVNYNDWVRNCTYICVIRPKNKSIKLKYKLPIRAKDYESVNQMIKFNKLNSSFNPTLSLPKENKTEPGTRINIFNPNSNVKLNLNSGSYQFQTSKSIDKEGYYTEVIIYDKISNLLYYERMRFHAFQ